MNDTAERLALYAVSLILAITLYHGFAKPALAWAVRVYAQAQGVIP